VEYENEIITPVAVSTIIVMVRCVCIAGCCQLLNSTDAYT